MLNNKNYKLIAHALFLIFLTYHVSGRTEEISGEAIKDITESPESSLEKLLRARKAMEDQEKEMSRALREQSDRLMQQWRVMDEQSQMLNKQKKLLEEQRQQFDELRIHLDELAAPAGDVEPEDSPQTVEDRPGVIETKDTAAPDATQLPETPVGQAPPALPRPPQPTDILEKRSVLTPQGMLTLEPSVQYIHSSVTRVFIAGYTVIPAIVVGAIEINEAERNSLITTLAARYGLSNNMELNFKVPHVYRKDKTTSRPVGTGADSNVETTSQGQGIGDIEFGASYVFNQAQHGWPYFIGGLRFKAPTGEDPYEVDTDPDSGIQLSLPTGSGFWSIQPGINISLPSDPAVLYGNISYLWNVKRTINDDIGTVDPGDALSAGFGIAFALNHQASFNLGYSHNIFSRSKQNGQAMAGSKVLQVGTFQFGMNYRIHSGANLGVSVGIGATDDAPDVNLSVQFPAVYTTIIGR